MTTQLNDEQIKKLQRRSQELSEMKKYVRHLTEIKETIKNLLNEHAEIQKFIEKRDEMYKEINQYSIEMQKVQSETQDWNNRKNLIQSDISVLEAKVSSLKKEIDLKNDRAKDLDLDYRSKFFLYEDKVEKLRESVNQWNSKLESLKEKTSQLNEVRLNDLQRLNLEIFHLSSQVSLLKVERKAEEEKIAELKQKEIDIFDEVKEASREVRDFYKSLKPYIYEIVKWYRINNRDVPVLLQDWKPKSIIYTDLEFKRLRGKTVNNES